MNRRRALLTFAIVAVLLAGSNAQETKDPSTADRPAAPVRVGPPPAGASPSALEAQGDKLRADKAYVDALDYYRAVLKKAPSAAVWNKIGITELQLSRFKEAAKSFDHASKLDAKFPEAYNNRGAVYYIVGASQQASSERAGKSVPRGARKNYRKAIKEYMKALELQNDSASYHSNLGTAYFALKEYPAAINEYAIAMQLDPEVFEHRSQTGIAAQMSSPQDRAYYSFVLARMYAKSGNSDRALQYLRKAMEDGYKDIDAVYKDQEFAALRKDPRFSELMASKPQAIPQ
ncbi:MAG: tetratricopeptide repeat protein [Acidobacteriia bacterium]|nr:tetratricopeptide repeat protein [Terriglobia bacterium]